MARPELSRRRFLKGSAAGAAGLAFAQATSQAGASADKNCIFLFLTGGPSQLDTWDPKPSAPSSVRGPFKPAATKVSGLQLCEHFTKLPQVADKIAVIRSLGHDDPAHLSSGHTTLTGHLAPVVRSDATPPRCMPLLR